MKLILNVFDWYALIASNFVAMVESNFYPNKASVKSMYNRILK